MIYRCYLHVCAEAVINYKNVAAVIGRIENKTKPAYPLLVLQYYHLKLPLTSNLEKYSFQGYYRKLL